MKDFRLTTAILVASVLVIAGCADDTGLGVGPPSLAETNGDRALADFNFPDFSSIAGINLVGNAARIGDVLRLTPSARSQRGAAWFATKELVQGGFTTTFQFQITQLDQVGFNGADGFAFVIQNSSVSALGRDGSGMGYGDFSNLNRGIANSVAVEFDTFKLSAGDPNGNHIAVHSRGTLPNTILLPSRLAVTTTIPNLSDGSVHTVRIGYVPGTMSIFLDDLANPALTVSVDLAATLSLDAGNAFVGFTAATGAGFENHDILNWSFSTIIEVQIDIRPGSDPNSINCNNEQGVVAVWTRRAALLVAMRRMWTVMGTQI
jgi:hypothetical protein